MARTSAMPEIDDAVTASLSNYAGADIEIPASLRALGVIRNAVYRFNRQHSRRFRLIVADSGVVITERPALSPHLQAAKDIARILRDAMEKSNHDGEAIAALVARVVLDAFASTHPEEEVKSPEEEHQPSVRPAARKRAA